MTAPKSPVRVAHVLASAQRDWTSIATVIAQTLPALAERGCHAYAVFLGSEGPLREVFARAGANGTVIPWTRRVTDPLGAARFWRTLNAGRFDIVHAHVGGRLLLRLSRWGTGSRVLLHVHSGVREADGTFHGTVTNADGADAVVAVSNAVAASVTGLPVTVIHPGVPIPDLAARPSAPRGEFVIGAVGRLEPGKSYADLIRALPKLPHSVRLEIAGDGNAAEALQQLARDLGVGDRVTLLGWVQDLRRYYTRWSLFAHPSQSEGFAISILQAMAAGLPVIATSVGGTPEAIIDGESGLLVPVGQPDALAAAISRVVDDPNLGASLGGQARARVARLFSVEHQVDATERLYRALLSSARA